MFLRRQRQEYEYAVLEHAENREELMALCVDRRDALEELEHLARRHDERGCLVPKRWTIDRRPMAEGPNVQVFLH